MFLRPRIRVTTDPVTNDISIDVYTPNWEPVAAGDVQS